VVGSLLASALPSYKIGHSLVLLLTYLRLLCLCKRTAAEPCYSVHDGKSSDREQPFIAARASLSLLPTIPELCRDSETDIFPPSYPDEKKATSETQPGGIWWSAMTLIISNCKVHSTQLCPLFCARRINPLIRPYISTRSRRQE
jgi:hypothetical protein